MIGITIFFCIMSYVCVAVPSILDTPVYIHTLRYYVLCTFGRITAAGAVLTQDEGQVTQTGLCTPYKGMILGSLTC